MEFCNLNGVPHSTFKSWSDLDQDKALAHMLAQRSRCGQCGTVPDEWLDEAGEDREPPPYVAMSVLCVGCDTIQDKISAIPEKQRSRYQVYLVPNSEVEDGDRRSGSQSSPTG